MAPEFNVFVNFATSTPEEWKIAQVAQAAELPALSAERKAIAKSWGFTEEDERRNLLRQNLAVKRMEAEGQKLGRAAARILETLGENYRLRAVILDGRDDSGVLRFEAPSGLTELKLGRSLRESIVRDGGSPALEDLKREILVSLGRQDLLAVR